MSTLPHQYTALKQKEEEKASVDVTAQTDVNKLKTDPDGSFKRPASTFRSFVQENGEFPPEKGSFFTRIFGRHGC